MIDGRTVDGDWPTGIAPSRYYAEWNSEPRPPFRTQAFTPWARGFQVHDTLSSAIRRVAEALLPPRVAPLQVEVLDEGFSVVFAMSNREGVAQAPDLPVWFGVRAAYAELEQLLTDQTARYGFDHMDLALWEGRAMTTAPGGDPS